MRYLLPLLLLCSIGCRQTEVLRDNLEDTNVRVNETNCLFFDFLKRQHQENPQDIIVALAYEKSQELVHKPLPTQIELPPPVPAELMTGVAGALNHFGLGGGVLGTLVMTGVGMMYRKRMKEYKGDMHAVAGKNQTESAEYLKSKGHINA